MLEGSNGKIGRRPTPRVSKRAAELQVGDLVDLEGDVYADPCRPPDEAFAGVWSEVDDIRESSAAGVVVAIVGQSGYLRFPPDHLLEVKA